ncbi:MAG: hypothetical protein AAGC66_09190 [Leifsonia sp.]
MSDFDSFVANCIPPYAGTGSRRGPARLLGDYYAIITNVADGYDDVVAEYYNDLSCRYFIQEIIDDPRARELPGYSSFVTSVTKLDDDFKALLTSRPVAPGRYWWETHLPLEAGAKLREECQALYGYSPREVLE